jgi:hypothetical protein
MFKVTFNARICNFLMYFYRLHILLKHKGSNSHVVAQHNIMLCTLHTCTSIYIYSYMPVYIHHTVHDCRFHKYEKFDFDLDRF